MAELQKPRRIAFATFEDMPLLYADDTKLLPLLADRQITVVPLIWSKHYENSLRKQKEKAEEDEVLGYDAIIFRSCWDYHLKRDAFEQWLGLLSNITPKPKILNPIPVLKWNLNKLYLRDLAAKGVTIPKTLWFPSSSKLDNSDAFNLAALLTDAELDEVVFKPIVSLSAHETWRSSVQQAAEHQERFLKLVQAPSLGGMLIQEFISEVTTNGEMSFVFIRGKHVHTISKTPKAGDFRVQSELGAKQVSITPDPSTIQQAEAIMRSFGEILIEKRLINFDEIDISELGFDDQTTAAIKVALDRILYARLDVVQNTSGQLVVIELELIDPELYFTLAPSSKQPFVDALVDYVYPSK
eukprot:TRINITY_DN346_c0_g1_i1.p1 TRINITY_DN346_c0_g1~~TRINITY_DN346_c0_g1_i1.p1  ORF type:complete len:355 (+),score=84.52 TRINITY_DN346_c0_g1_i1:168-1232(+)